jgi:hypothetical protein
VKRDERPRVFLAMPSRGAGRVEAAASHYALPTCGAVEVIPGYATGSLLGLSFNLCLANALNYARAGAINYFCLHHDDIQVVTPRWLDILVTEMERTGAAVLSVVQPIKDTSGYTSTAVETPDPWRPRKLTLAECGRLPETFSAADLPALLPDYQGPLLVNTGLLLLDLSRPEWTAARRLEDNSLYFRFSIDDRIAEGPDGQFRAEVKSEDWNFSRLCHEQGLPVYATRLIECLHWGDWAFSNRTEGS